MCIRDRLGGVDTVQVDADELFTADSVNLEDIDVYKRQSRRWAV